MSNKTAHEINIESLIPQRKPFLFLDKIIEYNQQQLVASFTFHEHLDFFKGHFPFKPIVPGVLLSESCFQSAAALISLNSNIDPEKKSENNDMNTLAVVSRIQNAKFRNMVFPNDTIKIKTQLIEKFDNAAYFKSNISNQNEIKILSIEFTCTLVKEE